METSTEKQLYDELVAGEEKKYAELDPAVKARGVEIIKTHLPANDLPLIANQIKHYGKVRWVIDIHEHFGWGMHVRNLLRQHGLTDDQVPSGNLDDYYVCLVEEATGMR